MNEDISYNEFKTILILINETYEEEFEKLNPLIY